VCKKVFDHVRTILGARERHRGSPACFWTVDLCSSRLAWPGLPGRSGNGSASYDRGGHRMSSVDTSTGAVALPRDGACDREEGQDVSLARGLGSGRALCLPAQNRDGN
jgi:hypothetical protein